MGSVYDEKFEIVTFVLKCIGHFAVTVMIDGKG